MVILETDRLQLRHFHLGDALAMEAVFCDPDVMQFSSGVKTRKWVREWIPGNLRKHFSEWGFGHWAVVEKKSHRTMGFCGLMQSPEIHGRPEIELGYRLAKDFWGHGYATEAAIAVRDFSFQVLGIERLISLIDPQNLASIRVAEKVGMVRECEILLPGYDHPDVVYAVTRDNSGS